MFIIGNWKMQLSESESVTLAKDVVRLWNGAESVHVAVCPSSIALAAVGKIVQGTHVGLGAQDVFWEEKGAYTGEVSPATLKELGCTFCIVGHSERRLNLGETDAMVNKKTLALLRDGITPIVCVGETLDERERGAQESVVTQQVRAALAGVQLSESERVVIAYEPRWAIGTGHAVAPVDAAAMHRSIRETVRALHGDHFAEEQCAVIYGGSVDEKNIAGLLAMDVIQGALVGGASLDAEKFVALARIASEVH